MIPVKMGLIICKFKVKVQGSGLKGSKFKVEGSRLKVSCPGILFHCLSISVHPPSFDPACIFFPDLFRKFNLFGLKIYEN